MHTAYLPVSLTRYYNCTYGRTGRFEIRYVLVFTYMPPQEWGGWGTLFGCFRIYNMRSTGVVSWCQACTMVQFGRENQWWIYWILVDDMMYACMHVLHLCIRILVVFRICMCACIRIYFSNRAASGVVHVYVVIIKYKQFQSWNTVVDDRSSQSLRINLTTYYSNTIVSKYSNTVNMSWNSYRTRTFTKEYHAFLILSFVPAHGATPELFSCMQ